MIPVARTSEPDEFHERCRQPGTAFLNRTKASTKPPDYWSRFRPHLCDAFQSRCGYLGIWISEGEVDHFMSVSNAPHLAYQWSNYRYSSALANKLKRTHDDKILDPFEVEEGWFEISLPDLQLRVTNAVPAELREKAEFTVSTLKLRDHETFIRQRQAWYQMYVENELTLEGLRKVAPLIAAAVDRSQTAQ